MQVVDVKDISVPDGTTFPVTITFEVAGVTEGSSVAVLHYNGSAWEKVEAKAGAGTITACLLYTSRSFFWKASRQWMTRTGMYQIPLWWNP